jgi:hypothetical protein
VALAREPGQRHTAVRRQLHGEGARRPDGHEDRRAGDRRLLHELEGQPPAHAQNAVREGQEPAVQRVADHLVHRVVASDVLARHDELAGRVEETGRMQAARPLEGGLVEPLG